MIVHFWCNVVSTMGTLVSSFYLFGKALNYRASLIRKLLSVLWCLLLALFYSLEPHWIPSLMFRVIYCVASIVFIWRLLKSKIDTILSAFLLAYGISNVFYIGALLAVGFVFAPFLGTEAFYESLVDFNEPIYILFYTLIAALQFLFAYGFFKIRRFKRGLPFLSGRYTVVVALIIAGIIVAIFSFLTTKRESYGTLYDILSIIAGIIIIFTGIYIWIRRSIKMFQRKKAWERNEELFLQEKEELTRELQHYKEIHETVRAANHKMMHRQSAAEMSILRLLEKAREYELPADFTEELTIEINKIRGLIDEYQESIGSKVDKKLPSTNIQAIDGIFSLFAERFAGNAIDFNLKVNGSIVYMAENVVDQRKLETMIGDHLQDALIAVCASNRPVRSVLAMIGEAGNCYEFSVHDSGIPFETDTLVRLGTERVTTHSGGSGIGFMTTFETMRECGASLIIHENAPDSGFSKIVTIRFDGENRYIIETYRPGDFPASDRYTVIGHKIWDGLREL